MDVGSELVPSGWSRTKASIEWAVRSKDLFEFSNEVEQALEEDYYQNPSLYTQEVLGALNGFHIVTGGASDIEPALVLSFVRSAAESTSK